jgi:hypothetical protein
MAVLSFVSQRREFSGKTPIRRYCGRQYGRDRRLLTKWLLVLAVTVIVASLFMPRLIAWLKVGRLPGDITVRFRGRDYFLPFATTLLLSLLATLLFRFI